MERITPREWLAAEGKLGDDVVAVKLGEKLVDLHTPVETALLTARATPVHASDPEALSVIRHSAAHVMADAVQRLFPGTKVTIGPAIEDGFYYDFHRTDGAFSDQDLARIEEEMRRIIQQNTPFRREVIDRNEALAMFDGMGESFKCEIIRSIPEGEEISLYRHGGSQEWVDVCEGPHVPSTGFLGAVKLTSVAGAYWRGDERNPMLQRVYGTAFPTQAQLDEHLRLLEEARARDHRKLGKELDLFLFDETAPAMPFFLPKGAFLYNRLVDHMRALYEREGYDEVITPQMFHPDLFRTSGHLGNYNENMYRIWTEDELEPDPERDTFLLARVREMMSERSFALKPMNCPSHCVIFGARRRSYRELPMRVADFGRLHRYERGGVVHGLSRVRSFAQDDAHIFCSRDQVATELTSFLRMFFEVYRTFHFEQIDVKLATRPDQRIGSDELWDYAEGALEAGLKAAGLPFEISPGEGAFYGPKLEFHVKDALKRSWQLGTFQFDPNLPERFELSYVGQDGKEHRPVMLHRAILGSIERFLSIYIEHCGGNFPLWLAPRQCIVLTVSEKSNEYGQRVVERLKARGIRTDADLSADKLGAKIRNARQMRYPYLCVVGPREAENDAVGVRSREQGDLGAMSVDAFLARLLDEISTRR
ncbi:MAG: threonine--tRNA ligase [Myxococcales bacterium]|nr:threonine--tRNA ligase [Polyangiaceae bacterium]MDW8249849.1 threonine--tRNA ligase [Myxococcales bacterium]